MECGVEGLAVLGWLSEHGHVSEEWVAFLRPFFCSTIFGTLIDALQTPSKVIAAVTSTYAAAQWWHYREAKLYLRLHEYINENDLRLQESRKDVIDLIMRPDRRTKRPQPAYALELKGILRKHNWEPALHSGRAYEAMTRQLTKVTEGIAKRKNCAEKALVSLRGSVRECSRGLSDCKGEAMARREM